MPRGAKILVVDDSPNVLKLVSSLLEEEGYQVETCGKIDQVPQLVDKTKPDLLVLDVMMPSEKGLDGFSLVSSLREKKIAPDLPVIFLTAIAKDVRITDQQLKEKTRADDFVSKPFDPKELLQKVEKLLKKG